MKFYFGGFKENMTLIKEDGVLRFSLDLKMTNLTGSLVFYESVFLLQ